MSLFWENLASPNLLQNAIVSSVLVEYVHIYKLTSNMFFICLSISSIELKYEKHTICNNYHYLHLPVCMDSFRETSRSMCLRAATSPCNIRIL